MLFAGVGLGRFVTLPVIKFINSVIGAIAMVKDVCFLFTRRCTRTGRITLATMFNLIVKAIATSNVPRTVTTTVLILTLKGMLIMIFHGVGLKTIGIRSTGWRASFGVRRECRS